MTDCFTCVFPKDNSGLFALRHVPWSGRVSVVHADNGDNKYVTGKKSGLGVRCTFWYGLEARWERQWKPVATALFRVQASHCTRYHSTILQVGKLR